MEPKEMEDMLRQAARAACPLKYDTAVATGEVFGVAAAEMREINHKWFNDHLKKHPEAMDKTARAMSDVFTILQSLHPVGLGAFVIHSVFEMYVCDAMKQLAAEVERQKSIKTRTN